VTFFLAGIPSDEEQATGLEKKIMHALKTGSVCILVLLYYSQSCQTKCLCLQFLRYKDKFI